MYLDDTIVSRFWSRVRRVDDADSCWEWDRVAKGHRYGSMRCGSEQQLAHRIAWAISRGPIPEGMNVLHRCNNTRCCRPSHLELGTQLENISYRHVCGRDARPAGEANGKAVLTADDVHTIRRRLHAGELQRVIAQDYGIQQAAVSKIKLGKSWAHI